MEKEDALKNAEIMLSLGGSYSEVADFLKQKGVPNPAEIITETVNQWVDEDKQLSESRRAIQRRRLMRQVRLAMDEAKVGEGNGGSMGEIGTNGAVRPWAAKANFRIVKTIKTVFPDVRSHAAFRIRPRMLTFPVKGHFLSTNWPSLASFGVWKERPMLRQYLGRSVEGFAETHIWS